MADTMRDVEEWVLDAACGTCTMAEELQRASFKGKLLAVDASRKMVRRAQRKTGVARVSGWAVLGDVGRLPLKPGCLEGVICTFSITTVARPDRAVSEFEQALRGGGKLTVLDSEAPSGMVARLFYHMLVPVSRFFCHTYIDRDISSMLDERKGLGKARRTAFLWGMVSLYEYRKLPQHASYRRENCSAWLPVRKKMQSGATD